MFADVPKSIQPPLTADDLHTMAAAVDHEAIMMRFDHAGPDRDPVAWAVHRERLYRARIALQLAAESASSND